MKLTRILGLNRSQYELDFVDVDINKDLPLFIDPHFLGKRSDAWSIDAARTINHFFQQFLTVLRSGRRDLARDLLSNFGEPNETCLGLSKKKPKGRGIGPANADDIFASLLKSKAVLTGIVTDIEDCRVFVAGIDKDKISDMATNLIRGHLIAYTQDQCRLWNIPMRPGVPSGFYWDRAAARWESRHTEMLIINDRKILLVPKSVVSYSNKFTQQRYHQHFVLNYLQNENLKLNTVLVQRRKRRDGTERVWVTKKSVTEKEAPLEKEYLTEFTRRHPDVFQDFRAKAIPSGSLPNSELTLDDMDQVIDHMKSRLQGLAPGPENATTYHRLAAGILELLFYPDLTCPTIEREIHDGRKRIDLTFDNAAPQGFFHRLHTTLNTNAQFVIVECKNYSRDLGNPELDQLSGRFSLHRGRFGLAVCRSIDDMPAFIKRCSDTYRDGRGVIIPLVDADLISFLDALKQGRDEVLDEVLSTRFRDIALQ